MQKKESGLLPLHQRFALHVATPLAVATEHRPFLIYVSLSFLVTVPNTKDYRITRSPFGWKPDVHWHTPLRFSGFFLFHRNSKSALRRCHHRLSSTTFHTPMANLECPGLISDGIGLGSRFHVTVRQAAGSLPKAFPSTQYLPGRQGFVLHTVTRLHRP